MKTVLTIILIASFTLVYSQTDSTIVDSSNTQQAKIEKPKAKTNKEPFIKRLYFGGEFGLSFGSYTTLTVSPLIGYRLTPKLYTGVQFHYTWAKHTVKTITGDKSYNYHNYGFSAFLRWYAIKNLYFHIEPEFMNYQQNEFDNNGIFIEEKRYWVPYIWAGAGLRKMISKRSWMSAHVLFDLLNDSNSPYREWEPRYSVGFGTSF